MKTFIIIGCLLFSVSATGQKHSISINYKPSLTYFGKQRQSFDHYYFSSGSGNNTFNSSANLLYSYKISPKINLTTGFEISKQGQNINFKTKNVIPGNNNVIFSTQLNYYRIPLEIGYSIFKLNKSEFNIYAGLSLGIVIKRKDNYQDIILENILLPHAEKRYKKQDWAIPFGLNFQRALGKNAMAIFGAEYLVGLTNSFTENGAARFGVLSEFDNSKQNRLSINIGIGFSLAK